MSYTTTPPGVTDYNTLKAPTNVAAGTGVLATTPLSLPSMPSVFPPVFVELTGSASALDALNASATDIGRILQGTVAGELASYQVRAGTDAVSSPTILHPANYHATANAVIFHVC